MSRGTRSLLLWTNWNGIAGWFTIRVATPSWPELFRKWSPATCSLPDSDSECFRRPAWLRSTQAERKRSADFRLLRCGQQGAERVSAVHSLEQKISRHDSRPGHQQLVVLQQSQRIAWRSPGRRSGLEKVDGKRDRFCLMLCNVAVAISAGVRNGRYASP